MTPNDDPFEQFAAEMARAANIEADAGLPLFDPNKSPAVNLAAASTMDEAAEIYLKAEALAKSARIQKKAAKEFLTALSVNKGESIMSSGHFDVTVDREDQLEFNDEAFLLDPALTAPDWLPLKERAQLTPTELKALTPSQRDDLGAHFRVKGEKISITVERK